LINRSHFIWTISGVRERVCDLWPSKGNIKARDSFFLLIHTHAERGRWRAGGARCYTRPSIIDVTFKVASLVNSAYDGGIRAPSFYATTSSADSSSSSSSRCGSSCFSPSRSFLICQGWVIDSGVGLNFQGRLSLWLRPHSLSLIVRDHLAAFSQKRDEREKTLLCATR
jgi:hypothetical protein